MSMVQKVNRVVDEGFDDTYHYGVAAQYQYTPKLMFNRRLLLRHVRWRRAPRADHAAAGSDVPLRGRVQVS